MDLSIFAFQPDTDTGMIRKKPAGSAIFLEVVSAMPMGACFRFPCMVHSTPSVRLEKNAFACPGFYRQEMTNWGIHGLRKSYSLLIRQQDRNRKAGEITTAGASLGT